jgi:5-methyltetrahydrofolate--homocysteine methyltransferase
LVGFDPARYEKIIEDSNRWWNRELKRPLIQIRIGGADPGRPEPTEKRPLHQLTHDLSVPPETIIDSLDYSLSRIKYLGDAFPYTCINLGPGVMSAFMHEGRRPRVEEETVWFFPEREEEIAGIRFAYDGGHPLYRRLQEILGAANEYWNGRVQLAMTDLGGNLDMLIPFRPGERLLLDLYDHPEEVKRLTWEGHEIWWRYFEELNAIMHPPNPGYLSWLPIFSATPIVVQQCDFCYMISPAMFDEFVKPELAATAARLGHSWYHLDGIGSLPHLDSLLEIEELDGVQWVYGDGKPGVPHWIDVYRKIREAGKLLYLHASPAEFELVADALGSTENIFLRIDHWVWDGSESEAREFLAKYGAD